MRSGSIRIGLGGDSYAYADADDALLTGLARSKGVSYEFAWDDTGRPYLGILGADGKPDRWVSVVRGPRGEVQSTSETSTIPFILVSKPKPALRDPLPKAEETVLSSDLKTKADFWGFDYEGADPSDPRKTIVRKNWEKSLGLPNWGADASLPDMAQWLLILAAIGIGFVAIDFATKD